MSTPNDIDAAVDAIEEAAHPNGRCVECGGGEFYWRHMGEMTGEKHPFAPSPRLAPLPMTSDTPRPPMTQSEPEPELAARLRDALIDEGLLRRAVEGDAWRDGRFLIDAYNDRIGELLANVALAAQSPVQPVPSGLEPIVAFLDKYGLANTSGDRHVQRRKALADARSALAATAPAADEGLSGLEELREALLRIFDMAEDRPDIRAVAHTVLRHGVAARLVAAPAADEGPDR